MPYLPILRRLARQAAVLLASGASFGLAFVFLSGMAADSARAAGAAPAASPQVGGCPLFPATAIFNQRVDDPKRFPVHPRSREWIELIGSGKRLHADFGRNEDPSRHQDYWGIPYNVSMLAPTAQDWPVVSYEIVDERAGNGDGVPDESDCGVLVGGRVDLKRGCETVPLDERRFPFGDALKAEHGNCNDPQRCGDRHILVVEAGACRLWESYFAYQIKGRWLSYSTAAWELNSNAMRPDGWTSGDAAGLPILPLLARADEASAGEIRHALRVTLRDGVLDKRHEWPARHRAGRPTPGGIPYGAMLRLRRDFVVPAHWTTQARALAHAMQRHGLIVSDIGSDLYVQGDPNAAWSEQTVSQFQSIRADAFEFIDLGRVTGDPRFDRDSYQAAW